MKNMNHFATILVVILIIVSNQSVFAQAPPPPGVPVDFGLTGLIGSAIAYGVYKFRN